jgi:hypothetical protein
VGFGKLEGKKSWSRKSKTQTLFGQVFFDGRFAADLTGYKKKLAFHLQILIRDNESTPDSPADAILSSGISWQEKEPAPSGHLMAWQNQWFEHLWPK